LAKVSSIPMLNTFTSLRWQDIVDILLVAFVIYRVILLIRGTRAVQMLLGITILIVMYFGARELELLTLYWLLGTFLSSIFLIIIIVFQRDIRRALTQVGQTPFSKSHEETVHSLVEIVKAAKEVALRKIGGLIVIERETGLKDYIDSGLILDAKVSRQLLVSLFLPDSPLHDGGVMIQKGRILSAGCVLPLSKNPYISKQYGTRHRAAIGLSEETDAAIIVISEETSQISLAHHGVLNNNLSEDELRNRLDTIFLPKEYQKTQLLWKNWLSRS
jgi:diadenylate cyclase